MIKRQVSNPVTYVLPTVTLLNNAETLRTGQHAPSGWGEMERHLPQIQKDMQSLGDGLWKQIEQFGRTLPRPNAHQSPNSKPNSF